MTWWKLAGWYFGFFAAVCLVAIVVTETVELLVGRNERDIDRSGRWVRRIDLLTENLRGAWILGFAWTFGVFVMIGLGMGDSTPTARYRLELVIAAAALFGAWILASIIRAGVRARHAERIDVATGRRR